MNESLRFNICQISTSYQRNDDIPGISGIVKKKIPESLEYACRYWVFHLEDIGGEERGRVVRQMLPELKQFVNEHALSLDGSHKPYEGHSSGTNVAVNTFRLYQGMVFLLPKSFPSFIFFKEIDQDFSLLLKDARNFLSTPVLSTSVVQIYISALPFASNTPKFAKAFQHQYENVHSRGIDSKRKSDFCGHAIHL